MAPEHAPVGRWQVLRAGPTTLRGKAPGQRSQHLSYRSGLDLQRMRCPHGAGTRRRATRNSMAVGVGFLVQWRTHATVREQYVGPAAWCRSSRRAGQRRESRRQLSPVRDTSPIRVRSDTIRSAAGVPAAHHVEGRRQRHRAVVTAYHRRGSPEGLVYRAGRRRTDRPRLTTPHRLAGTMAARNSIAGARP
jgi:hypothetical protein